MRYRRRPVEVEAIQWTGDNLQEVQAFCDENNLGWNAREVGVHRTTYDYHLQCTYVGAPCVLR